MTINVTAEDIKHGVRGSCGACPVALAIMRATRHRVEVYIADAMVRHENYLLPENAVGFIERFDSLEPVAPFAFELPYNEPYEEATR